MTALRSLLFNIAFFGWTTLLAVFALPPFLLQSNARAVNRVSKIWVRGTFAMLEAICRLDYRVTGLDKIPSGPCIIAAKH